MHERAVRPPATICTAVAGMVRDIRVLWLPCLLACFVFFVLAGLTQLQEFMRAVIFDFTNHLAPVCITLAALLLLVCALYRLCAAWPAGNPTLVALISSSPFAAIAVSIYLAAAAIAGARFLPQQSAAYWAAAAMALVFLVLVFALRSFARAPSDRAAAWVKLTAIVPYAAALLTALALLLPFAPGKAIVTIAQTAGPLGLAAMFCVVICALSTFVATRTPAMRKALLLVPLFGALAFGQFGCNANHGVRTLDPAAPATEGDLKRLFGAWYNSRQDRKSFKQYPVYIVATAGGGYYAAYHAARVLARLQDQCPNFAQHVFAISGVSGGSLGAGVFSSLVERFSPEQVPDQCGQSDATRYTDAVEAYFKNDFLSPILFYALGADLVQRFLPFPVPAYDRALGLEYAIERAWSDVERSQGLSAGPNPLQAPFRTRWLLNKAPPALVLNTTRVDTGQRVLFSPFRLLSTSPAWNEAAQTPWQLGFKRDVPTSTAIGLSARFPIVSPAGDFAGAEFDWSLNSHERRISLVDGGYFENSGTATAMDLFTVLAEAVTEYKLPVSLRLIVIGGIEGVFDDLLSRMVYGKENDGEFSDESSDYQSLAKALRDYVPRSLENPATSGELTSPISALLGTRTDQGKQAINRGWLTLIGPSPTNSKPDLDDLVPLFGLSESNVPFPLSWIVSRPVRERIALRMLSAQCPGEPFEELFRKQKRNELTADWRVKLLSEYGEDLRFIVELSRSACGVAAIRKALSATEQLRETTK